MHCWWEWKMVQLPWKTVWRVLKKLEIKLPYDPAIPHWVYNPKELKAEAQRDVCTPMIIIALIQ